MAAEAVQAAFGEVQRDDAPADAVLHDQVHGKVLDEELRLVFQRLLVKGVQTWRARSGRRRRKSLRGAFAVVGGHTAECALVDAPVVGAGKGHTEVFQLDDRRRGLLAHVFDGILIASQSDPLTVSYMCQRQSSGPMLPNAALMPPARRRLWLRVGNTLVMQAVERPCSASPRAARSPAPPAPTTTTSQLWSMNS